MIDRHDFEMALHRFLDELSRDGDGQDYYRLNHVSGDAVQQLMCRVESWLKGNGVDVRTGGGDERSNRK